VTEVAHVYPGYRIDGGAFSSTIKRSNRSASASAAIQKLALRMATNSARAKRLFAVLNAAL
jgi:hypothetical protein